MKTTSLQGSDVEQFFRVRLESQPPRPQVRPIVGVDECVASQDVAREMTQLCQERVIQFVSPCWWNITKNALGELGYSARFPVPRHPLLPAHRRVRGAKWPDSEVMWQLIAQFQVGDGVFFLSENRHGDAAGIRRLLEDFVRPNLATWHRDRYGLVAVWKLPTTPTERYASEAAALVREHPPTPGYREHCI